MESDTVTNCDGMCTWGTVPEELGFGFLGLYFPEIDFKPYNTGASNCGTRKVRLTTFSILKFLNLYVHLMHRSSQNNIAAAPLMQIFHSAVKTSILNDLSIS